MREDLKKRALHRAKILEGQVRGLQKAIEAEEYCMDIITQSLAIQKSLGSLNKLIAENHLTTHVEHMMKSGDASMIAKAQAEMLKLFELTNNQEHKFEYQNRTNQPRFQRSSGLRRQLRLVAVKVETITATLADAVANTNCGCTSGAVCTCGDNWQLFRKLSERLHLQNSCRQRLHLRRTTATARQ
jgi:DNA-binding FrmR family transcriptional regulator